MMKRLLLSGMALMFILCVTAAPKKKNVLLTIEKEKIALDEFMRIYERNNNNIQDSINKKSAGEYLELFINFKLKVLEAKLSGMDTTRAFREELAGYRTELATPYLTDLSHDDSAVEETYNRMLNEVHASHIMVRLTENPSPEDTLVAFKEITRIREMVAGGLDFNEAARQYSQDPSAQSNAGDLGWFTVFQMVYPFENMAYSMPEGQVSPPFRTRFGYHILKVHEFRKAGGEIHVAHIMKMYPQNATPEQKEQARKSADSLYAAVLGGADFAELARNFSDDQRSAEKGGEMPWFSRNRMIPEFSGPAFDLANDGDVSKPVDSGFGFHIIKRLGLKPVQPFSEAKEELTQRIKHDKDRMTESQEAFNRKLKESYQFTPNQEAISDVLLTTGKWLSGDEPRIPETVDKKRPLFTFARQTITAREWADFLRKREIKSLQTDSLSLQQLFRNFEDETILSYENNRLEEKYPDFKSLMEEYHDGMLLFDISEKLIWQKASADTIGLEKFYETNKQKYLWPERFRGAIIQTYSPQIRDEVEKCLSNGVSLEEIYDFLHLPAGSLNIREGTWAKGEDPVVDYHFWDGTRPVEWVDRTGYLHGKLNGPEPKELSEVRGYHIADYQQYLEEEWIRELRNRYKVKINKKLLETLTQ
jgi:peptidyl-prolyl cis-trans isomerase SurA